MSGDVRGPWERHEIGSFRGWKVDVVPGESIYLRDSLFDSFPPLVEANDEALNALGWSTKYFVEATAEIRSLKAENARLREEIAEHRKFTIDNHDDPPTVEDEWLWKALDEKGTDR